MGSDGNVSECKSGTSSFERSQRRARVGILPEQSLFSLDLSIKFRVETLLSSEFIQNDLKHSDIVPGIEN